MSDKNKLLKLSDKYIHEYAERIVNSKEPIKVINHFDFERAAINIKEAMMMKEGLFGNDVIKINQDDFIEDLEEYIKNNFLVEYLVVLKGSDEKTIRSLLRDKGTKGFEALKGFISETDGTHKDDYKVTEQQLLYIKTFHVKLKNTEDMTGREASEIIKCLKCKDRVKPLYYWYYIGEK